LKLCALISAAGIVLAVPAAANPGSSAETSAGSHAEYSEEGYVACVQCHGDERVLGIAETAHGDLDDPDSPAAQKQCQSCHGPSAIHMQFPMQVENVHFGAKSATSKREQNRMCLECHEANGRSAWSASAHGYEDVLCNRCHSIHDPDRIVPRSAAVETTCTGSCHLDLMNGSPPTDFSHRVGDPLEDGGTMTCASCHDPHAPLGSQRCDDCHDQSAETLALQSEKARRYHKVAVKEDTECIRCHKGIAHPIPPLLPQQSGTQKASGPPLDVR